MLFINPEILSGLGEDTFWTWLIRDGGAEVGVPNKVNTGDVILHYSTMGAPKFPSNTITLLWELYPEMELRLGTRFRKKNKLINNSLAARFATVPTHYCRAFYSRNCEVLPIAVNEELFAPVKDKRELRKNLGLNPDSKYIFWGGGSHPMKGRDLRDEWLRTNPDYTLLFADKDNPLPQSKVAELMNASDGILNTSRLVPLFMIDWEALSCDLPIIEGGGVRRDLPLRYSSRKFVEESGWFRSRAINNWLEYIEKCRWEISR